MLVNLAEATQKFIPVNLVSLEKLSCKLRELDSCFGRRDAFNDAHFTFVPPSVAVWQEIELIGLVRAADCPRMWQLCRLLPFSDVKLTRRANLYKFLQARVRMLSALLITILQPIGVLHHVHRHAPPDQ
jgi:hypothetical protein